MMAIRSWMHNVFDRRKTIAPLVTFRFIFGLLMFVSILRFWMNGWIHAQFVEPTLHFKYFGFYWIPDPSSAIIYAVFFAMAVSALLIAFGAFYRLAALLFFLLFTYVELIDATYYLNHYYFVSLVSFILIFLPANKMHALDVKWGLATPSFEAPAWTINLLKFQLGLVYFMAGVAKLNPDWLFQAMPLAIWLPAQSHWPLFGELFTWKVTAYAFSWAGAIYDLVIPFILLSSRFRWAGYFMVIVFHLMTWSMFQIGMFPFIMIGATLIFFSPKFHERIQHMFGLNRSGLFINDLKRPALLKPVIVAFCVFQLLFPFRNLLYSGNPFWHEQGYRFGWRVMLTEKAGYAQLKVSDTLGREIWVENRDFLTDVQEKMMATQPDFLLQYADFLKEHYVKEGVQVKQVTADVFVTMNGHQSRPFVDSRIDLAALEDSWAPKHWILPYQP